MTYKVMIVFGTRPEAIKMAPVVLALKKSELIEPIVCITAQHREMLDQVLNIFSIVADHDLDIMSSGQDLFDITSRVLLGMREVIRKERPSLILVHGDTTTCLAAGLSAFYEGVALGHVEAGLRTRNMWAPFPEEANRRLVAPLTDLNFAPTATAEANLLAEHIAKESIAVTGNTVIDALLWVREKLDAVAPDNWKDCFGSELYSRIVAEKTKVIAITGHRRENFGQGFNDLCLAIKTLAERYDYLEFVYPVHLNPNVQEPVNRILGGVRNIHLIEPLDYMPFVWLMDQSEIILTDSGGVQEEAPSLGKPVLVMRDVTERPEALEAGTVSLVGTRSDSIIEKIEQLILDRNAYAAMANAVNPYGDGLASGRIVSAIETYLQERESGSSVGG